MRTKDLVNLATFIQREASAYLGEYAMVEMEDEYTITVVSKKARRDGYYAARRMFSIPTLSATPFAKDIINDELRKMKEKLEQNNQATPERGE